MLVLILVSALVSYPKDAIIIISILLLIVTTIYLVYKMRKKYILRNKRNLFELIAYYYPTGAIRIDFNETKSQEELFELLWSKGIQLRPNPFGRKTLVEQFVSKPIVYNLCAPYMLIKHPIGGVNRFFNGFGDEVFEVEYVKSDIHIEFTLHKNGEQDLLKLLKIKIEAIAEDLVPTDKNTIDELFKKSFAYRGSTEYRKFFSFIAKFNHYSRYNSMLVYIQNPNITFFGSSYFWRVKFQRTVNGNAKPHIILAPGGPVILAYDIFDTSGKQSAQEFLQEGLNGNLFEIKGEFKKEYLLSLTDYATKYGIKVLRKPMSFFQGGAVTTYVTKTLEIYLREANNKRQHFSTLCHELAHIFLGHTGHKYLINTNKNIRVNLPERNKLSLKQEELEAETVNFLVCKKLGLETQSIEYLAGYIEKEDDWNKFSYEFVIKVADRLQDLLA